MLNGAGQQFVEVGETLRAVHEGMDGGGLLGIDPRGHVDQDEGADQFGGVGRQRDGGEAPEGHPDHAGRIGGQGGHHLGQVRPVALERQRAIRAAVGVTVAREVDGHERPVQHHGDGVPRVGVLGTPVYQDQLGWRGAPDQAADLAPGPHLHVDPAHRRGTAVGQPVLGRVLRKQTELVVGHHVLEQ